MAEYYPNLVGLVDPRVEQAIRLLYQHVYATETRARGLESADYLTKPEAEARYGPRTMTRELSLAGSMPLYVQGLLGILTQPQSAGAPRVTVLPPWNDPRSQEGALTALAPTLALYRFDGSVSPGVWRALAAAALIQYGLRVNTPGAGSAGKLYYQTDTGWLYYDNGTNYVYLCGADKGTDATRLAIAAIGANDNGALFFTTDTNIWWRVSGGAWVRMGECASVDLTNQSASLGDTTLFAVPAGGAGVYRVTYYLLTTTAGNAVTCLTTIKWTDLVQPQSVASAAIDISTLGDFEYGTIDLYSAASQNISYATTVSGGVGIGRYALYLRGEAL